MPKSVIVHLPFDLDARQASASQKRPHMMMRAFGRAGFSVELVSGPEEARFERMAELRRRIAEGERFAFVYSESSTMPLMLTGGVVLPRRPFADHRFLRFCRRSGIPVGLYYRDVHWRFPHYRRSVAWYVRAVTVPAYYAELLLHRWCIDVLFLPSLSMARYVPLVGRFRARPLPPGADEEQVLAPPRRGGQGLEVLYVGGVGPLYRIDKLVQAVRRTAHVRLTICTRPGDWQRSAARYSPLLGDGIRVVHASGGELRALYADADVCAVAVAPQRYWSFAVPFKLFEYAQHGRPVIATEGTETGRLVSENGIGWTVAWQVSTIAGLLAELRDKRDLILERSACATAYAAANTWERRVKEVGDALRGTR